MLILRSLQSLVVPLSLSYELVNYLYYRITEIRFNVVNVIDAGNQTIRRIFWSFFTCDCESYPFRERVD